jgi:hypothetical protein
MRRKSIEFLPSEDFVKYLSEKPVVAAKSLPRWFREYSQFFGPINDKFKWLGSEGSNASVKACVPLLDGMTAGYTIPLPFDIEVTTLPDGQKEFRWRSEQLDGLITGHHEDQVPRQMIPKDFSTVPYKFRSFWSVKTPPGYSAMFVHPLNRFDLPFVSMSAIVDTDDYHIPVNFPFVLRQDFSGIIEAGTPMIQVIPFKRDSWDSSVKPEIDRELIERNEVDMMTRMWKMYKKQYWKRKDFK